jgi:hypothetical protein
MSKYAHHDRLLMSIIPSSLIPVLVVERRPLPPPLASAWVAF